MADFSFNNYSTLSILLKSSGMNIYGSTLWRYKNHSNIDNFCVLWRKTVRRLWKTPYRTHNSLVHLINNCDSMDCILEKRWVIFLCNLFYSDNVLFSRIIRYSKHNSDTTIGENTNTYIILSVMIFLLYLTDLIINFKSLHSWMIFV